MDLLFLLFYQNLFSNELEFSLDSSPFFINTIT